MTPRIVLPALLFLLTLLALLLVPARAEERAYKSGRSVRCLTVDTGDSNNVIVQSCQGTYAELWDDEDIVNRFVHVESGLCMTWRADGNIAADICNVADGNQDVALTQITETQRQIVPLAAAAGECIAEDGSGNVMTDCDFDADDIFVWDYPRAVVSGTILDACCNKQWHVAGGPAPEIVLTLQYATWHADVGVVDAVTQILLDDMASSTPVSESPTGWNAEIYPILTPAMVTRVSDREITIAVPLAAAFSINAAERVNVTIAPSLTVQDMAVGTLPAYPLPIIFDSACAANAGVRFSTRPLATVPACSGTSPGSFWQDGFENAPVGNPANYCDDLTSDQTLLSSPGTCNGPSSNLAYRFELNVQPLVSNNWAFRVGADFGEGGAIFVDGVPIVTKCGDLWWNFNWGNTAQTITSPEVFLSRDKNSLVQIYGLEGCCAGGMSVDFYAVEDGSVWKSATAANLQDLSGEFSCGCYTECGECTLDDRCGWCADGNCDPTGENVNADLSLGQCLSGNAAGPTGLTCDRWNFEYCEGNPIVAEVVATDPDDLDGIYSAGDVANVYFNASTNQIEMSTKADIDRMLTFSPELGSDYSGAWANASTLVVTILATAPSAPEFGLVTVSIKQPGTPYLLEEDGCAFPFATVDNTTFSGTYGEPPELEITKASNVSSVVAGDAVHFTLTLVHNIESGSAAQQVVITDTPVAPGLEIVPSSVAITGGVGLDPAWTITSATTTSLTASLDASGALGLTFPIANTVIIEYDTIVVDASLLGTELENTADVDQLAVQLLPALQTFTHQVDMEDVTVTVSLDDTSLSTTAFAVGDPVATDIGPEETFVFNITINVPRGSSPTLATTVTAASGASGDIELLTATVVHAGSGITFHDRPGTAPLVTILDAFGLDGINDGALVEFGAVTRAGYGVPADTDPGAGVIVLEVAAVLQRGTTAPTLPKPVDGAQLDTAVQVAYSGSPVNVNVPIDVSSPTATLTGTADGQLESFVRDCNPSCFTIVISLAGEAVSWDASFSAAALTDLVTNGIVSNAPVEGWLDWRSTINPASVVLNVGAQTLTIPIEGNTYNNLADEIISLAYVPTSMLNGEWGDVGDVTAVSGSVTIRSEDSPSVLFVSATDNPGTEASGVLNFGVRRYGSTSGAATVDCSVAASGTALAPADFATFSGTTISWGSLDAADKQCVVTVVDDTLAEDDETLGATLSNPSPGVVLGAIAAATGTIEANDAFEVVFNAAAYSVNENAGTVTLQIDRTAGITGAFQVDVTFGGGDATASDYDPTTQTIAFLESDTSVSFTVDITDDNEAELDETFVATLGNLVDGSGQGAIGAANATTVTILASDPFDVMFNAAAYSVDEDVAAGTVTIQIDRTAGITGAFQVDVTFSDGSAVGADYGGTTQTITFNAGDTSVTFTVPIVDDAISEADETFTAALGNLGGAISAMATIPTAGFETTEVTIVNDDDYTICVQATTFDEGDGSPAFVSATLSGASDVDVTVDFSASGPGSATAVLDYTATTGTLTWPALSSGTQTATVAVVDDFLVETDETFTVSLSNPGGRATISCASTLVMIEENDFLICGDGIRYAAEECDDGNTDDGDGCSSTCTIEPNAQCNTVVLGTITLCRVVRMLPATIDEDTIYDAAGTAVLQLEIDGDTWHTDVGTDAGVTATFLGAISGSDVTATGFNTFLAPTLGTAQVTRVSGTIIEIALAPTVGYAIDADEILLASSFPASLLTSGVDLDLDVNANATVVDTGFSVITESSSLPCDSSGAAFSGVRAGETIRLVALGTTFDTAAWAVESNAFVFYDTLMVTNAAEIADLTSLVLDASRIDGLVHPASFSVSFSVILITFPIDTQAMAAQRAAARVPLLPAAATRAGEDTPVSLHCDIVWP